MSQYTELLEVIKSRRSIGRVKEDRVPRQLIENILEAGIWAPSHYQTEPWKFFVLEGAARAQLGEVLGEIYRIGLQKQELTAEEQRKYELQNRKPLRAPVIIAVAAVPSDKPQVTLREELAAVSSAVQNMLLAAEALGLGAIWRTGEPTYHPLIKKFFGLREIDEMVGFIYIGYPDMAPAQGRRTPFQEKTHWMNDGE
jgi:nitroreductase